jgi:hypothetical protein
MSFNAMAWAARCKTGSPTKKLILLLLADRANDKGFCFPSIETIAEDCELGTTAVKSNIKSLSDSGFLSVERRKDGGAYMRNVYHLDLNCCEVRRDEGVSREASMDENHGHLATNPETLGDQNHRREVSTNQSLEPIKESDIYVEGSHKTPVEDSPIPPTPGSAAPPSPAENERKRAKELESGFLDAMSRAKGRKLISKPTGEGICRLMKKGVTEQEIIRAFNWLYENARDPYCPVVESGKALYDKWDKVQAGMARSGYSGPSGHKERAVLKNGVLYFVDKPKCESQYMRTNYLPEHDAQYEILTPEQFKGGK